MFVLVVGLALVLELELELVFELVFELVWRSFFAFAVFAAVPAVPPPLCLVFVCFSGVCFLFSCFLLSWPDPCFSWEVCVGSVREKWGSDWDPSCCLI